MAALASPTTPSTNPLHQDRRDSPAISPPPPHAQPLLPSRSHHHFTALVPASPSGLTRPRAALDQPSRRSRGCNESAAHCCGDAQVARPAKQERPWLPRGIPDATHPRRYNEGDNNRAVAISSPTCFGSSAGPVDPVALCPYLAIGLPFSKRCFVLCVRVWLVTENTSHARGGRSLAVMALTVNTWDVRERTGK